MFGPMVVEVNGKPLRALVSRRGMWLLAILTLRANREVARDWLSGCLWPDSEQSQALSNLRRVLTDLRSALGDAANRLSSPTSRTLQFNLQPDDADVLAFDRCVSHQGADIAELEHAVSLYNAPLLEDCYEPWAARDQAIRRESYLTVLDRLVTASSRAGSLADVIRYLRLALAAEPMRESFAAQLMQALADNGDMAAAGEVFRKLRVQLMREMNTEPSSELRELFANLRRSRPAQSTQSSKKVTPANQRQENTGKLPHTVTPLIGRDNDVAQVGMHLKNSRIVTLVGAGGIGKTRLSIEIAHSQVENFDDGVWFVELALLNNASGLADAVIDTLGLRETQSAKSEDDLALHLNPRSVLLVLDNCEHLVDETALFVTRLTTACPDLRILATSRQPLGLNGEIVVRVPSLSVPLLTDTGTPDKTPELELLCQHYSAIKLFIERANAVRADLATSPGTIAAIIDICHRLDGIPLAIELAAARTKSMSVLQIASRLDNRFNLLVGGSRSALPRHKTLLALVDWSYDLLSAKERLLLARLSIFMGGFTLEAVEDVCSDVVDNSICGPTEDFDNADILAKWEMMDLLSELVDKSIVNMSCEFDGEPRYSMLETIRQYASEKNCESDNLEAIRGRHCHSYLKLAYRLTAQLTGERQKECLLQFDIEQGNLRAALNWSLSENEPPETAMRICGTLNMYWVYRGYYREGSAWCSKSLARSKNCTDLDAQVQVLNCSGTLAMMQGDHVEAMQFHNASLSISRKRSNMRGVVGSLERLGVLTLLMGKLDEARTFLVEAIDGGRVLNDSEFLMGTLINLGCVEFSLELGSAQKTFEESLALARVSGNKVIIALALGNLAHISKNRGDFEEASLQHEECLRLMQEVGDKGGVAMALYSLATVAEQQHDTAKAFRLLRDAITYWQSVGNKERISIGIETFASILVTEATVRPEVAPENHRLAARMYGGAATQREILLTALPPDAQGAYDTTQITLKQALGLDEYSALWEKGRAMAMDDVLVCVQDRLNEIKN